MIDADDQALILGALIGLSSLSVGVAVFIWRWLR